MIGTGAVEVKSTLSPPSDFPRRIGSLEQLDDSMRQPLFVAAVPPSQLDPGHELADDRRAMRFQAARREATLSSPIRLIAAGYFDAHADSYIRRFGPEISALSRVTGTFPATHASTVPFGDDEGGLRDRPR